MNMKWYWARIGIGALVIFCVGFAGIKVVRSTKRQVERAVESNADLTIPLPFVPFNLDGTKLGTFRKVTLHRSKPDQIESVDVTVRVEDPDAIAKVGGCHLTVDDPSRLNERSSFRCVTMDDSFESFGTVAVQTKGADGEWASTVTVPLVLTHDAVRRLQGGRSGRVAPIETARFRELTDSLKVLAKAMGRASSAAEREALSDKMAVVQEQMNDLRDAMVQSAVDKATAAAEAGVRAATGTAETAMPAPAEMPPSPKPPIPPSGKAPSARAKPPR